MNPVALIAQKEAGDLLFRPRGLMWLMALAVVLSAFALLLVGNTELSLLDNAQVVYAMTAIVTGMASLLAMIVGVDTVAGERERASLLPLLLTPVPRDSILAGKSIGIAIAWAVIYLLAIPYVWAVGSTGQNLGDAILLLIFLGTPVVLTFGLYGMALGTRIDSARSTVLAGLTTLVLAASPIVLGPSLRQSSVGQIFDAINPFAAALNAYDAVIIDSQPIADQWSHTSVTAVWLILSIWAARSGFRRLSR